jgi:acyl-CoA thioesterase II
MGDLSVDTALEPLGDGRFSARLSRDWEIWGPMGGYVAAIALRAAGATNPFDRPATFYCHYLGVADFDTVDLEVTTLRSARTAISQRVSMRQGERAILDATVWSIGATDGLEHDEYLAPDVPPPTRLGSRDDLPAHRRPPFPFWDNVEMRAVTYSEVWPPKDALPPVWQAWCRFRPRPTFEDDPWLDAARAVILLDVQSWPAASRFHAWKEPLGFIAPSLDVYVAFHEPAPTESWLLADGCAPVSLGGLLGWNGRLWTTRNRLVASGGGQALYRRIPPSGREPSGARLS